MLRGVNLENCEGESTMNRREFLGFTGMMATAGLTGVANASEKTMSVSTPEITGAVTDYFEFRIAGPEIKNLMTKLKQLEVGLKKNPGFLSLSLKQMVGESTMVKNYPADLKGILGSAYADSAKQGSLPFFYSLFVRFNDYNSLQESRVAVWFRENVFPLLHAYKPTPKGPQKTPISLTYYHGVFQTILAGNRQGIYSDPNDIQHFLRASQDSPSEHRTTVANHVMIHDENMKMFEKKIVPLLKVAQQTYQPENDPNHLGKAASKENNFYRKAVTTEIMRKAIPDGDFRAYLMHGVWESMLDHENSHLDRRFRQHAGPVGAMVAVGPVEPFYETRFLARS